MDTLTTLSLLVFGHFLMDYPLQGTWIATTKDHKNPHPSGYPWVHSLTAHSVLHGGVVGLITGSLVLGYMETIAHWAIDYFKSDQKYGVHVDQSLHILCKMLWCIFTLA